MKVCYRIGVVLVALLLLVSCGSSSVTGNGKVVTKARKVMNFNEIKVSGAYQLQVTQGNQNSVKVITDSNVEPLVITEVDDGTLDIHNKNGVIFKTKQPVLIQVVVQKLDEITAAGSNKVTASHIHANEFEMNTTGGVQAKLSGKVNKLSMDISGSGNVNASKLVANSVKVRLTGSGQVQVNAVTKLDSKITGSGSIMYAGNPKDVDQSIVGSGKLERLK